KDFTAMNVPFGSSLHGVQSADAGLGAFVERHIGPRPDDIVRMLQSVGTDSLEALVEQTIPAEVRQLKPLDFGPLLSEAELLDRMRALAAQNVVLTSLIGQGYY